MFMVDIKYTQNFFTNLKHLQRMVEDARFSSSDVVLDIGAGEGNISRELCKYAKDVIAYEFDSKYFEELEENLRHFSNIEFRNEDFLTSSLPRGDFKIFSNIPFALTSDIVTKITGKDSSLTEAYLFVQMEAAQRFLGEPINTQIATILNGKYSFEIIEDLDRMDFRPVPSVDIVLLKISRKKQVESEFGLFKDFVTYIFNQMNKSVLDTFEKLFTEKQIKHIKNYLREEGINRPSEIPKAYYLEIFQYFKTNGDTYKKRIQNYYQRYIQQHSSREKVNRTRS